MLIIVNKPVFFNLNSELRLYQLNGHLNKSITNHSIDMNHTQIKYVYQFHHCQPPTIVP
jgi:hypothetical protein